MNTVLYRKRVARFLNERKGMLGDVFVVWLAS